MYLRLPILIAVFAILTLPAPAAAQRLSARGGVDLTNVSFEDSSDDTSAQAGFVGGMAAAFRLAGPVSLQVEGLFAQKRISIVDGLIEDRLTFLDVPILASYEVFRNVHVLGGGIVSFRLAASENQVGEEIDIKDGVKPTNAGLVIGGDYEITSKWVVDARYVFGLTGTYLAFDGSSIGKLRTLQIAVGYRFR